MTPIEVALPTATDAERDAFIELCERLAGFDAEITPEWTDGYLTALAAGPVALTIDDWLEPLFGDAFDRAYADPTAQAEARAVLGTHWRRLLRQLDPQALIDDANALRLDPVMMAWDDEARAELQAELQAEGESAAEPLQLAQTGALWALGLLAGWQAFGERFGIAHQGDDDLAEILGDIEALTDAPSAGGAEPGAGEAADAPPMDREALIDAALFAAQDLRVWSLDHAPMPETRRVAPQPGRNDPCPCGSGRKFKKCHGA